MNNQEPVKPRRTRGTPSQIIGHRFSLAILGVAVAVGIVYQYTFFKIILVYYSSNVSVLHSFLGFVPQFYGRTEAGGQSRAQARYLPQRTGYHDGQESGTVGIVTAVTDVFLLLVS